MFDVAEVGCHIYFYLDALVLLSVLIAGSVTAIIFGGMYVAERYCVVRRRPRLGIKVLAMLLKNMIILILHVSSICTSSGEVLSFVPVPLF